MIIYVSRNISASANIVRAPRSLRHQQQGVSLVVSLLMLVAVLMLGISAAQMALQGEKASRNDRDRQIAFQAAEAALKDAELDIQNSPDPKLSRSNGFLESPANDPPLRLDFTDGCGAGESNVSLGLCAPSAPGITPVWQTVDLLDDDAGSSRSVPYGKFTGQAMQTGKGFLPGRPSRYIIEILNFNQAGQLASAENPGGGTQYFYRITAIGFGARDSTKVVLQSYFHKIKPS
jgi:type IV pilus assembly protein PilX